MTRSNETRARNGETARWGERDLAELAEQVDMHGSKLLTLDQRYDLTIAALRGVLEVLTDLCGRLEEADQ